jgi:hypothetical protein
MLPSISPLSGVSTGSVQVPPPPRFRPILGMAYGVDRCEPRDAGVEGMSAAQRAGMRYERKVHDHFASLWGDRYVPSPVFSFYDASGKRFCIPDGLLDLGENRIVVFEIKFQHMPEAWWQLDQLYRPVLKALYKDVYLVEVCRSFDPATPFPCAIHKIDNIEHYVKGPLRSIFGVYRWR